MVDIASEVIQQADNIKFKLAGEGPERKNILQYIRKYGIGKNFILTGFVENIANYYQTLDHI